MGIDLLIYMLLVRLLELRPQQEEKIEEEGPLTPYAGLLHFPIEVKQDDRTLH